MTELLQRPAPLPSARDRVPPPAWISGLAAGLTAAAGGAVACLGIAVAGWLTGNSGSVGAALRVGAAGWLLAHGHVLDVGSASISLIPLGLTALLAVVLTRSTRAAASASQVATMRSACVLAATCAVAYAGVVLLVAVLTSSAEVGVELRRGTALSVLLAGGASVGGAWHGPLRERLRPPPVVRALMRGALVGALALFGSAALVLTVSLAVHVEAMQQIVRSLDPGLAGGLVLVLGCGLVLPNVVLLTTSVLLGPGTALGVGTSVTLTEVSMAPLPAVPWLAAVPSIGTQPVPLAALAVLPVLAGIVAGLTAVRRLPALGHLAAVGSGAGAGVVGGLLVGVAIALAGGSAGPGRMAEIGAPALMCLAVAAAAFGLGGLLGGAVVRLLGRRRA
jgi:hypothetical protein